MVKKIAGIIAGMFTPTVITTSELEGESRGRQRALIKVMKWRRGRMQVIKLQYLPMPTIFLSKIKLQALLHRHVLS